MASEIVPEAPHTATNNHARMAVLGEIYSSVLARREAAGEKTAGLCDEVFKTRSGYFGSITLEESVHLLPHLRLPEDGNATILDLGSGSARFIFHLVAIRSNIHKLIGIEDEPMLHEVSCEVLAEAMKFNRKLNDALVKPEQIELLKGNFFDPAFRKLGYALYSSSPHL